MMVKQLNGMNLSDQRGPFMWVFKDKQNGKEFLQMIIFEQKFHFFW